MKETNGLLPMHKNHIARNGAKKSLRDVKIIWFSMLMLEVCLYSSYSPLVHICQIDGKVPFSSSSLVLFIEIAKLCISIVMYLPEVLKSGLVIPSASFCLPLCVPAILYTCNNNIAVHMQQEMDPTTYQVLGNLKIATTAVLYRIVMAKKLSNVKWISLGLLTIAGVLDSVSGSRTRHHEESAYEIHLTISGMLMMLTYCFISGLSGVYTEFIFKKNITYSIHLQNIILYIMGIILNLAMWVFQGANQISTPGNISNESEGLLTGFTIYTWTIVISQAVNGLIMSVIMKYGSNITRLFIVSCAMLMTTVLSVLIFSLQLNLLFVCAFILVIVALMLYHRV